MTEADLYHRLKATFPLVDWQRIETMTHSGIPDVNYCFANGIEGWIELKIGIPRLKPSQVAWHTRAIAKSRRAFILTIHQGHCWLYRTNKFHQIDTKHFTPSDGMICKSIYLNDISSCLTASYNLDRIKEP